jgi:WD40 repeat protein
MTESFFVLNLLPHVHFVGWDVDKCCLEGTRVEIIDRIISWAKDISPNVPKVFWFTGPAGSGKTTITHSIAQKLHDAGMLGGSFFFKRDIAEQSDPTKVIVTLAYEMASHNLAFKIAIAKVLKEDGFIPTSPSAQLQKLLIQPLITQGPTEQMCLLLDALDECGTQESRKPLLKALATALPRMPQNVKLFVTSRSFGPQADIDQVFGKQLDSITSHLELDSMENHRDILQYTKSRLQEIIDAQDLDPTWPGDHITQKLAQSTDGMFLWAYVACTFIANSYRPDETLMDFISEEPAEGDEEMGNMYATALKNIKAQNLGKTFISDCCRVLGVIATVRNPLPASAIAELLAEDLSTVLRIIKKLDCLLVTQSTDIPFVRVIHASFARWLTSSSNKTIWAVSLRDMHSLLEVRSLSLMNDKLHMDMLGLSAYFYALHHPIWADVSNQEWMINSHISFELQYACQFWITHLLELEPQQEMQSSGIEKLLFDMITLKPLEWVEVLAYLGKLKWAVEALERLLKWLQVVSESVTVISNYVHDMKRFIQSFSQGIQESPLQIYFSALLFTPQETMLYKCYTQHIKKLPIKLLQGYELEWGKVLNIITGHEASVETVAFSPDCTLIASGSSDMTVRIWDVRTGSAVGEPLCGHNWSVRSVSFSPDGTQIASGSSDKTICMWDSRTGAMVGQPLQGHTDQVASVVFSPDGTLIVSGSHDMTVRIWDTRTGAAVGQPLQGHTSFVTSVAFSSDGTRISSGSYDKTVRIWNAKTGAAVGQPFQGHTWCVTSVAFSPDGTLIASGSYDKTVHIWDTRTGVVLYQPLQRHTSFVTSIAFSPDGTLVASGSSAGTHTTSGSSDRAICIWDARTGAAIGPPLHGHTGGIRSLAFSSDGTFMLSGSDDKTLCIWDTKHIWDTKFGVPIDQPQGHTDVIRPVAFSPDGTLIASGSNDKTVCIWNARTGAVVGQPLQRHTHYITSVAFSPDGTLIASGSEDKTVCIWEAKTGAIVSQILQGHTLQIPSVVFSPDSTLIASGSHDGKVCIWNSRTGAAVGQPLEQQKAIITLAFSFDGALIASGLDDKTVCIWNTRTRTAYGEPLQGHTGPVTSVAFSPNGTLIASGSEDNTVRIWDVRTGAAVGQPLQRHTSIITSVAFSPDGSYIISSSSDATVNIWNTRAAATSDQPLQDVYEDVNPPYDIENSLIVVKRPSGNIWVSRYSADANASPILWLPPSFCGTPYFHFQVQDHAVRFVFVRYSRKLTIIQVQLSK